MAKTIRVPVALTEEQHEVLSRAASEIGLTLSAFLRAAALEKARK